jgi:hypothetical protein
VLQSKSRLTAKFHPFKFKAIVPRIFLPGGLAGLGIDGAFCRSDSVAHARTGTPMTSSIANSKIELLWHG